MGRARFVKWMGISALAVGCLLAMAASPALALYYPSGPQTFVQKSKLKGWELCFSGFYGGTESLDTVLTQCDRDPLLLAGGPTGSETLTVLAAAPRDDVLFDTGTSVNDPHNANGSGWYYNDSFSWGFAKKGDPITRDECDVRETPHPKLRLCWHTLGVNELTGGYRAGAVEGLNESEDYTRYIYQGPPPCPKNTLCVWEDEGYQGKRLTIDGKRISNKIAHKMDDAVTSVYNRRNGASLLYPEKNGEGESYCVEPKANVGNVGVEFNDVFSSSKLTAKDGCPGS